MTVTVSPENPRSVRAFAVLATADRWTKGHTKDGRSFFVIPGSNGHLYWTNTRDCSCPDRQRRETVCKHMTAVRTWVIEQKAAQSAPVETREQAMARLRAELGMVEG